MDFEQIIMNDILWNFKEDKFKSLEKFKDALKKYNEDIKGEPFTRDLNAEIINSQQVVIQYSHWDEKEEDTVEPDFLLDADNDSFFKKGELLFKVHNMVYENLKEEDHCFFQGFDLWQGENHNYPNAPLYFLIQGS